MVSCAKEELEITEPTHINNTEYRTVMSGFEEMANSKTHLDFLDKTYDFLLKAGTEVSLEMLESPEENFIENIEDNYEKTDFESEEEVQEAHKTLLDSYIDFREENASYFKVVEESEETIEVHYEEMGGFAGEYFSNLSESSAEELAHTSFGGCLLEAVQEFVTHVFWALATYHTDGWAKVGSLYGQK